MARLFHTIESLRGWLEFTSLRQRLMVINLIATGATLVLVSVALVANAYLSHRSAMVERIQMQATTIAKASASALVAGDRRTVVALLTPLVGSPDVTQAAIFDANGEVVAAYRAQDQPLTLTVPSTRTMRHFGGSTFDVDQPIVFQGRSAGSVRIEASLLSVIRRVAWFGFILALAGIGAIGLCMLVTDRLITAASRPLIQLARLMERVSTEKDFSLRASVHVNDEVGALATGFNRMLHRIEERERALKRQLHERKRAERRLATLANYDALTRLPNRNYFNERLTALLARSARSGEPMALLFLDLDNFKIVNDTLGHHLGDALLKAVGKRIRSCVRASDSVCRLGGDEFTMILEDIKSGDDAGRVAETVVTALSHPFALRDNEVYVTCSIGISVYPKDGRDASTLIKCGDTAMYHAKERGKNNFKFFSADMNDRALKRLALETGLRQALERGEFLLYYQPQVDLASGAIVGAEALLRWRRPGVGLVGPQEFIPIAEETGLIVPIGEWVLWAACSQANLWQSKGQEPVRISINVSPRQFREGEFVRSIANVLEETRLDPFLLVLELTESVLMEDVEAAIAKAHDLRAMGVALSIDDFGVGYSSMSYLKRFPIIEVKIDRSFVSDIPTNGDDVAITKAIVAMAQGLSLEVVAEGVETQAQAEFLRELGCNRAQGHYLGRAGPAEAFEQRLARARDRRSALREAELRVTDAVLP